MALWTINPRDPLIFRDGKPFNADAGARAKSLPFPFPSTIIGAVRTLAGTDPKTGKFDTAQIEELLKKKIYGPLLIELGDEEQNYLFPAPADALLLKHTTEEEKARLIELSPMMLKEGEKTDLDEELAVIAPSEPTKEKPHRKAPHYWKEDVFLSWLKNPVNRDVELEKMGHDGPVIESRMHVQIDANTGTGDDSALFQTSGLEFTHLLRDEKEKYPSLSKTKMLALAIETDADLNKGMGFLGGERRVAQWEKSSLELPKYPPEVKKEISQQGACRLILLTPAYFEKGYIPTWLKAEYDLEIIAAAVPRYQVVSGWDYKLNKPKPTRRLVPAGSVYFLKIGKDIQNFIDTVWMYNISDGDQNRLDGFGLAVLGSWDGKLKNLEVKHE